MCLAGTAARTNARRLVTATQANFKVGPFSLTPETLFCHSHSLLARPFSHSTPHLFFLNHFSTKSLHSFFLPPLYILPQTSLSLSSNHPLTIICWSKPLPTSRSSSHSLYKQFPTLKPQFTHAGQHKVTNASGLHPIWVGLAGLASVTRPREHSCYFLVTHTWRS